MKEAIGALNIALEVKTSWNTRDLKELVARVHASTYFTNESDKYAFGQAAHNFELFVNNNHLTSMGRNQFKQWFINSELPKQMATMQCQAAGEPGTIKRVGVVGMAGVGRHLIDSINTMDDGVPPWESRPMQPSPPITFSLDPLKQSTPIWEEGQPTEAIYATPEKEPKQYNKQDQLIFDLQSECLRLQNENIHLQNTITSLQNLYAQLQRTLNAFKRILGLEKDQ